MHIQYITRRGSADTVLLVLLDGTFWETLHDLVDVSWPEMEQYLPAGDRWTMVISCGNAPLFCTCLVSLTLLATALVCTTIQVDERGALGCCIGLK